MALDPLEMQTEANRDRAWAEVRDLFPSLREMKDRSAGPDTPPGERDGVLLWACLLLVIAELQYRQDRAAAGMAGIEDPGA